MKKVFLLMMVVVLGATTASAQFFIGGSIGFDSKSYKPEGGEKSTSTSFNIKPEFGYSLTDKFDLGIAIGFDMTKDPSAVADKDDKTTGFEVAPFVRYSMVEFGKFSVLARGEVFFGTGKTEEYSETPDPATGNMIVNKTELKNTDFGVRIKPVLKYSLSDKFDLLADLNFMAIGFTSSSEKVGDTKIGRETNFNFGVDSFNVTNFGSDMAPLSIGFAFKF